MNVLSQLEDTADVPLPNVGTVDLMNARQSHDAVMDVRSELKRFEDLRRELESMDGIDEQTLLDTLEGESNLDECLLALADEIAQREAMVAGLKSYIDNLTARKNRNEKAIETFRTVILAAMERAKQKNIVGERATLNTRRVAPKLIVDDESQVPSDYFIPQPPKVDKKALTTALETLREQRLAAPTEEARAALKDIPGARLSDEGISLSIRTK